MKPTNKTEVEWFIHGVLSTAVIDNEDWSIFVVELAESFKVFFRKHQPKWVNSGVGDEKVCEYDSDIEEYFTWLKSESPEKLRNYAEEMVKWLND